MVARRRSDGDQAIYVISVAAELAGVHPQTLRVYERKGLLRPQRTAGNTRRYSPSDIETLRRIQELTEEGVNLAGVTRIMELEDEIDRVRDENRVAREALRDMERRLDELVHDRGGMSLVPMRDIRRVRRAMKSDAIERAGRRRVFAAPPVANQ